MLFVYCCPNFDDFRNSMAVTPIVTRQLNIGSAYLDPGKLTRSLAVTLLLAIGPMALSHPLLKPGLTRLISSYSKSPFSVSHKLPVTGSIANPKLFLIPYA